MKARTSVVDWSGNYEENCIQLGKHLGKNKKFAASFLTLSMVEDLNRVPKSR